MPIATNEWDVVLVSGVRWTPDNAIQPAGDHLALLDRTDDGRIISTCDFTTQHAADNHATDIECDQRRNTWLDPTRGRATGSAGTLLVRLV